MSILKFILLALVVFGLWVSEPLWRKNHSDNTTASSVAEPIMEERQGKDEEVNLEAKYLKELEIKFGPRPSVKESTGVPSSVYAYWNKTLQYPDSLAEESCGLIRGSDNGWTTMCRYRAKNSSGTLELREDRFIFKNGAVYKSK